MRRIALATNNVASFYDLHPDYDDQEAVDLHLIAMGVALDRLDGIPPNVPTGYSSDLVGYINRRGVLGRVEDLGMNGKILAFDITKGSYSHFGAGSDRFCFRITDKLYCSVNVNPPNYPQYHVHFAWLSPLDEKECAEIWSKI